MAQHVQEPPEGLEALSYSLIDTHRVCLGGQQGRHGASRRRLCATSHSKHRGSSASNGVGGMWARGGIAALVAAF